MKLKKLPVAIASAVLNRTQDGYASKAMDFMGKTLIDDPARLGLPDDFFWDEEDRHRLSPVEATDPKCQRARYAPEKVRRQQRRWISVWSLPLVTVLGAVLVILGHLGVAASGIGSGGTDSSLRSIVQQATGSQSPSRLSDEQLAAAIDEMVKRGVTADTANAEELALIQEHFRRRGGN